MDALLHTLAAVNPWNNVAGAGTFAPVRSARVSATVIVSLLVAGLWNQSRADPSQQAPQSADSLKQLSLEELGNVEVTTVSKDPQRVMKTPAAIYVITGEDIRRSGATNIPDALRLAPGVQVARIDADHWSVSIRGFSGQFSRSLLVLIDGRSVYTPLYEGVYWNVQNVILDDVARIEVIRGPGGTIWGANAVNGVINIITKSAEDTRGTLVSAGGGNVDQGTGAIRYGGSLGKDFNYRIYGMGLVGGPEFHADGDGFDTNWLGQMGFHVDWKRDPQDSFTLQGDVYRQNNGERITVGSFSPPAQTVLDDTGRFSGGNVLARWQHKTEGSDIQVQAYFDRTNLQDFQLGETRYTFDLDLVQHVHIHGDQELTWGLGARVSPSNFIQTTPVVNFLPQKQVDTIYSGFLQYELPIIHDKLTLIAGTKLEHNNFSGFDYQPSGRLLWTPTDRQSFWAAVTRAVRTPSRLDTDISFDILAGEVSGIPVYLDVVGDPKLKPEQLIGYEAGYRTQVSPKLYLDFTGFYNRYSDLQGYGALSLAEGENPLRLLILTPYANVIAGHTIGAEIAPNWKIKDWWQVRASYSYLHMQLGDMPGFTDVGNILGSYLGSSPNNMAGFQSLFDLPKHFELDTTYRYMNAVPGEAASAYSTVDVRLGWKFKNNLDFSVVGQNLLRPHHQEFGGDPGLPVEIKRAVYAKITWTR